METSWKRCEIPWGSATSWRRRSDPGGAQQTGSDSPFRGLHSKLNDAAGRNQPRSTGPSSNKANEAYKTVPPVEGAEPSESCAKAAIWSPPLPASTANRMIFHRLGGRHFAAMPRATMSPKEGPRPTCFFTPWKRLA
jgi:hypothetical protein